MLPVPTVADLGRFSGRGADAYAEHAETALEQAALLLALITGLDALPDDPAQAALATHAILEMADRLYLEQSYAETLASPFQSETIGSYSYSKSTAAMKARTGDTTGLLWWDLAVDKLSRGTSVTGTGSVGGGFETWLGTNPDGRVGIDFPGDEPDVPPYHRIS